MIIDTSNLLPLALGWPPPPNPLAISDKSKSSLTVLYDIVNVLILINTTKSNSGCNSHNLFPNSLIYLSANAIPTVYSGNKSSFTINKKKLNIELGDLLVVRNKLINYIGVIESIEEKEDEHTTEVQTKDFISILKL